MHECMHALNFFTFRTLFVAFCNLFLDKKNTGLKYLKLFNRCFSFVKDFYVVFSMVCDTVCWIIFNNQLVSFDLSCGKVRDDLEPVILSD